MRCLVAIAVFAVAGCITHSHGTVPPWQTATLVSHVCWNVLHGRLTGQERTGVLHIDAAGWEPGDIILCHNPDGAYGYWTHAALYVGRGMTVDASDFTQGVRLFLLERYEHYAEIAVLRPKVPDAVRTAAAIWCLEQVGKPYDPLAAPGDTQRTYCSKLVWDAYRSTGTTLVPSRPWLVPDDLARADARLVWHRREGADPPWGTVG
jgi:cell wall-associated NlpC family hydrolase